MTLTPQEAVKLKGARLATIRRDMPPFEMKSLPQGVVSILPYVGPIAGSVAKTSAGKDILVSNDIRDPAIDISRDLAFALASQRGTALSLPVIVTPESSLGKAGAWAHGVLNNQLTKTLTSEGAESLARTCQGSDYVLDVKTTDWSTGFYRTNWLRYRIRYTAQMRLIETQSGDVVAKGTYKHRTKKTDSSPRYATLLANDAARLKAELNDAAKRSAAYFKTNVLGL